MIKSASLGLLVCIFCACSSPKNATTFVSGFTPGVEGPAVNSEGRLFAVNFAREGTVGVVETSGDASVFLTLPQGSIGNGIRFDLNGDMFIADYSGHRVYMVKKGSDSPEIWAENKAMNQPNDLAIHPDGTIYLSDPNWAEETGNLWKVKKDRTIQLLEANMGTTNGIEISPDGKTLYVNESVQRNVWKYTIDEDGALSGKELFYTFQDFGMDGMRCDVKGNLYITRYDKGTVIVLSPTAELIKEYILIGKKPSNIAFGGPDGKTCFVTMADRGCIETFRADYPGNYYSKAQTKKITP